MQLNRFLDDGAVRDQLPNGTFTVDQAAMKRAVTKLTGEIMTLQAEGSYAKVSALLKSLGVVRPGGSEGARPAQRRPGRHRAALRHGRKTGAVAGQARTTEAASHSCSFLRL